MFYFTVVVGCSLIRKQPKIVQSILYTKLYYGCWGRNKQPTKYKNNIKKILCGLMLVEEDEVVYCMQKKLY